MERRTATPAEIEEISRHIERVEAARLALPAHATPVFGLLRVETPAKTRELLLGPATAITAEVTVLDWRTAPLATVFFAAHEGESFELELDEREVLGTVLERTFYTLEKGSLTAIAERGKTLARDPGTDTWLVDEHAPQHKKDATLTPRPSAARDAELHLDPGQRRAVDLAGDRSVLVLGEAGFGKTTVALHRLARLDAEARAEQRTFTALVIVPTRGLERLTKQTLERLGVNGARVSTYDAWVRSEARRLFGDLPERDSANATPAVIRLKRHPALRRALPELAERGATAKPVRKSARRKDLLELFGDSEILERVVAEADGELPQHAVRQTIEHTKIQFSPTTEKAHAHVDADRLVTVDGRRIDEGTPTEDADSMDTEDCAVMFEVQRLRANKDTTNRGTLKRFDQIVIDEAQELAEIELALIGRARAPGGALTVAGDAQQQTDDTAYFPGWDRAMLELGVADHEAVTLLESHRCPPEITRFARALVGRGRADDPIDTPSPPGTLLLDTFESPFHLTARLIDEVRRLESVDPRATVAVVCRSAEAARRMQANLHRGLSTRLALGGNFDFRPGVVVTSVTEVKGLEFDTVILPDADETTYPDTQEARRALYVAATRPLWQLWLLAGGKTSPLVENALGIDSGR